MLHVIKEKRLWILIPTVIVIFTVLFVGIAFFIENFQENTSKITNKRKIRDFSTLIPKEGEIKFIQNHLSKREEGSAFPSNTNKVWSSVVFNNHLESAYLIPFAVRTGQDGLTIGVPEKSISSNVISANIASRNLRLTSGNGIRRVDLTKSSDLLFSLDFYDDQDRFQFNATFIQGSPFIYIRSEVSSLNLDPNHFELSWGKEGLELINGSVELGIFTQGSISQANEDIRINFENTNNRQLTIYLNSGMERLTQEEKELFASNLVRDVNTTVKDKGKVYEISYNFNFVDESFGTVFGLLPHHKPVKEDNVGNIDTIRGTQRFFRVETDRISSEIPKIEPLEELLIPEGVLGSEEIALVQGALERDVERLGDPPPTSYFGGKYLAKVARLIQIADIMEQTDIRNTLLDLLETELADWFTYEEHKEEKYLAYDQTNGGIIFFTPEFGSEKYNDHHFHYGYFIYSGAVLAKLRPAFIDKYGDVVDLIIMDIANTHEENFYFPKIRTFDFYEGHSWASGDANFFDGNNQESSSEAINAWYSIWLWGKNTGRTDLEELGQFLYSSEINSAKYYWLNHYEREDIFPEEYQHDRASLVWGGKVEFNTFFSTDPLAVDGIQYLPITPGSVYLYEPEVIQRDYNVRQKDLIGREGGWVDINQMYYAMLPDHSPNLAEFERYPLDDGNSMANAFYWVLYWRYVGSVD